MASRQHRLAMHAVAAVLLAGVAVVVTGGVGSADTGSKPDTYGGDATAASVELRVDKSPSPFPVVTDPFHLWFPYAETSLDSSGGATGIAASIYPGQDIIGVPALICEFAAQLCNSIPGGIPDYPAWAQAQYPAKQDASATLSQKPFPGQGPFEVTPHSVTAHADPNVVRATTTMAGADLSSVLSIQSATTHSEQHFEAGALVVTAESVLKGVDIGGGALHIDAIRSTAVAKVDGRRVSSSSALTTLSGATVAGTPVTIDSSGIHVAKNGDNGAAKDAVNSALARLAAHGIDAHALDDAKAVKRGLAKASTGGILVSYDFKVSLPVEPPVPNVPSPEGDYIGTLTLGGAGVDAYASPATPLGQVSLPVAPPAATGAVSGAPPAAGSLPGAAGTGAAVPAGNQPAVVGPPGRRPVALLGVDLTNKRLRALMLVLLGYPLLVLLTAPLRAPARFPRLR